MISDPRHPPFRTASQETRLPPPESAAIAIGALGGFDKRAEIICSATSMAVAKNEPTKGRPATLAHSAQQRSSERTQLERRCVSLENHAFPVWIAPAIARAYWHRTREPLPQAFGLICLDPFVAATPTPRSHEYRCRLIALGLRRSVNGFVKSPSAFFLMFWLVPNSQPEALANPRR